MYFQQCGRVSRLNPQLAGIIRFGSYLTVLLNPTSRREAFHMCLISLSPRHMYITTTHMSWASWAQAYKAHVGGVSPRCGIE